jgi:DNA-binding NarL/FixJ family response regulator
MINIFIADDHDLFREGLKMMLQEEPDMEVVGEAKNSNEVLEKIRKTECDILITDLNMPGRSVLEMILNLKILKPLVRILVLSISSEDVYASRVIKAGANGYISKDVALSELVNAIRKIYTSGKYLSSSYIEQLAGDACIERTLLPHENLSNREFEIMCMIASGKKVTDIAMELSLSNSTIHTYRAHIFKKIDVTSNTELTHYAMEANLVD